MGDALATKAKGMWKRFGLLTQSQGTDDMLSSRDGGRVLRRSGTRSGTAAAEAAAVCDTAAQAMGATRSGTWLSCVAD